MTPTFDFSSDKFVDPDEAVARNRDFQIDLFTDALGLDVVRKLGEGKQGACYLLGNGNVFKVSSSYSEGVLAYAQSQIGIPALPQILNVYSIDYEEHTFIGFEREEADDVMPRISNDQNTAFLMMDRAFKFMRRRAFNIQETYPEDDIAMSLQLADQLNPTLMIELDDLLRDVQEMRSKLKILITDVRLDNLGRTKDGRLVVRDFGINNLTDRQHPLYKAARILELPKFSTSMQF